MFDDVDSRRRFLQRATTITLGALSLTVLPVVLTEDDAAGAADQPPNANAARASKQHAPTPLFGFLVDTEKCIGSGKCLTACRVENDVPEGYHRTWIERYVHFKDGRVQVDFVPETGCHDAALCRSIPLRSSRAYFVPKLCNHCKDAPCNQVCPVHASFTSPEGVELIDAERCIRLRILRASMSLRSAIHQSQDGHG